MKKIIGILLMVVMTLLLLSGCGIPQEEHDAVVAERDAAQTEVASLQGDLGDAESQIGTLESDLTEAESQIQTLQGDYEEAKSNLAKVQSQISSLQSDYNSVKSNLAETESDLAAAEGQYTAFKSDLDTLWTSLQSKLSVQSAILDYWNASAKYAYGAMSWDEFLSVSTTGFMTGTSVYVSHVGNTEVSQLWDDFLSNAALNNEAAMMGNLTDLTDLLFDLIGEDIEAIEAKLAK